MKLTKSEREWLIATIFSIILITILTWIMYGCAPVKKTDVDGQKIQHVEKYIDSNLVQTLK